MSIFRHFYDGTMCLVELIEARDIEHETSAGFKQLSESTPNHAMTRDSCLPRMIENKGTQSAEPGSSVVQWVFAKLMCWFMPGTRPLASCFNPNLLGAPDSIWKQRGGISNNILLSTSLCV